MDQKSNLKQQVHSQVGESHPRGRPPVEDVGFDDVCLPLGEAGGEVGPGGLGALLLGLEPRLLVRGDLDAGLVGHLPALRAGRGL